MTRDRYKTVTNKESFALLVACTKDEAEGEATFGREVGEPVPVRTVKIAEMKKYLRSDMKGTTGDEFWALLELRSALESRDKLVLLRAQERLEQTYQRREVEDSARRSPKYEQSRREFGEFMAPYVGMPPSETLKHLDGLRPGPRAKKDLHRLLSYEVSLKVGLPQIVLWWNRDAFRPAIYCVDLKTAAYVHTFFISPSGGHGFRICPFCSEIFFQDRPNQEYCQPAHREAHRVARWRHTRKLQAKE